jgi:hypothetical protein
MAGLNIGVLTFHRCINYGSYWQARCMVEGLQSRGHTALILDHESTRINIAEWKCALQPVLPTPVPISDRALYREKIILFFKAFDKLPLSRSFPLHDPARMENFDVVVVGSDEVWNLFHPWYGSYSLFFGEGIKSGRLISYAASFGNYPASRGLGQEWISRLMNFDCISIRDENSKKIIEDATGVEPQMVLDPALQFSVAPEERESDYWQKPYVAVYGHNFSDYYIRKVQSWARRRNLPLVSIGYRNDWADEQWISADPHDFAHFIARSQAVVTNFFHGCVFALRNEKPFVCETSHYRSHKVQSLMKNVGGEKHLIWEDTPASVLNTHLNEPIHRDILQRISHLRQGSNEYLEQALDTKQLQRA